MGMWAADEVIMYLLNVLVLITVLWLCKRLPIRKQIWQYFGLKGHDLYVYTHTYTYVCGF